MSEEVPKILIPYMIRYDSYMMKKNNIKNNVEGYI